MSGKIPELSDCKPGLAPMEYNVVIAPETIEERTSGGVFLPQMAKETEELAAVRGRLVAASPLAFNYDQWPEGARKPEVGDAVLYAKYGGTLFKGVDDREYRVLKDKDVVAVITA